MLHSSSREPSSSSREPNRGSRCKPIPSSSSSSSRPTPSSSSCSSGSRCGGGRTATHGGGGRNTRTEHDDDNAKIGVQSSNYINRAIIAPVWRVGGAWVCRIYVIGASRRCGSRRREATSLPVFNTTPVNSFHSHATTREIYQPELWVACECVGNGAALRRNACGKSGWKKSAKAVSWLRQCTTHPYIRVCSPHKIIGAVGISHSFGVIAGASFNGAFGSLYLLCWRSPPLQSSGEGGEGAGCDTEAGWVGSWPPKPGS